MKIEYFLRLCCRILEISRNAMFLKNIDIFCTVQLSTQSLVLLLASYELLSDTALVKIGEGERLEQKYTFF